MKKFLSYFISSLICVFLVISCNNVAGTGFVSGINDSNKATVTIGISGMLQSGRNVMPDDWTDTTKSGLTYKITGYKDGSADTSNAVPVNSFTYEQIKNGTAKIDLDPVVWKLVLTAYQGTEVALVSGETTADLTGGSTSVEFELKATTEETNATGSVEITVIFPKSNNFNNVVYGLYASGAIDSTAIEGTTPVTDESDDITVVNSAANTYSFTYSEAAVKAGGTYHFNAKFSDDAGKVIGYYSTLVVVDGGNKSSATITLGDIFNKPPVQPANLAVSYSLNQSMMNAVELESGDNIPDEYDAVFTWEDKSDNETGFELVIDDGTNQTTYTKADNTGLQASSTSALVILETGKVYTISLRSVNSYSPAAPATPDASYITISDVNLYTVTYNLNNGSIKKSNAESTDTDVITYVVPFNKTTSALALISSDTSDFPYVYRNNYNFVKWIDADNNEVTEIAAENTANIELNAVWSSTLGFTITMPTYGSVEDYALVQNYSEAAVYAISGEQTGINPVRVELEPNAGLQNITYTLYELNGSTPITLTAAGDGFIATDNKWYWTITDNDNDISVDAGTYRIEITGEYGASNVNVTGNIYIKIVR